MGVIDESQATPPARLAESRSKTDQLLSSERQSADAALHDKQALREQAVDQKLEETREQVDDTLAAVAEQASDQAAEKSPETKKLDTKAAASTPETKRLAKEAVAAERSKAQDAVATVAETAKQVIEVEREHVDELSETERDQAKHDFLEVLAAERSQTDKALQQERGHADRNVRSRDDALAMIAHDLRNYLNVMGLKAELLTTITDDARTSQKLANEIGLACRIMQRWANDLVDIASIETGEVDLARGVHDPKEILDTAYNAFSSAAAGKGVRLTIEVPDRRPRISADRDRIVQVLNNLLDNALKFVSAPGEIHLSLETLDDRVQFSIRDTGLGIPEPELARIFERYGQTYGTHGGTGLGLFISRRIVEAHGGQLTVESKPGHGSTFRFTIPIADEPADA